MKLPLLAIALLLLCGCSVTTGDVQVISTKYECTKWKTTATEATCMQYTLPDTP